MKNLLLMLFLLIPNASAELRINSNLNYDGTFVELTPENCRITGEVQYQRPTTNGNVIISIENIICGDKIFTNGFD